MKYRYLGQWAARYHWISTRPAAPGESRYEHVSCDVNQFWSRPPVIHGNCCQVPAAHDSHFYEHARMFYCNGDSSVGWMYVNGRQAKGGKTP